MGDEEGMVGTAVVGAARRRRHFGPEDRARWLALFARSGQGVREFCREHGVGQSTLSAWRRGRGVPGPAAASNGLVKVAVSGSRPGESGELAARSRVLIRLNGGRQIEVPTGTDVAWVAALSERLDGCSG